MELQSIMSASERPDPLSHDRVAELKEAFGLFDHGAGSISTDELRVILLTLTPEFTEEELQHILREADIDQSGSIDFAEFVSLMVEVSGVTAEEPSRGGIPTPTDMMDLFKALDGHGSGYVEKDQFLFILKSGGDALTNLEAEELWLDAVKLNCVKKDRVHYKKYITKLITAETRRSHDPIDGVQTFSGP